MSNWLYSEKNHEQWPIFYPIDSHWKHIDKKMKLPSVSFPTPILQDPDHVDGHDPIVEVVQWVPPKHLAPSSRSGTRDATWATKKTFGCFPLNPGCLIGILIIHCTLHITGQYNPLYTLNNQGAHFFIAHLGPGCGTRKRKRHLDFGTTLPTAAITSTNGPFWAVNEYAVKCWRWS